MFVHKHTGWHDYNPAQFRIYKSMGEFLDFVESLPGRPEENEYDNRWRGGVGWKETLNLARNGWKEGMKKASDKAQKIATRVVQDLGDFDQEKLEYNIIGAGYDIGAYMSGVPEHWINLEPYKEKRAVNICVNVCASAGIRPETLMERGIATSALILALQTKGHPVNVYVGCELSGGYSTPQEAAYIKVYDANSPTLDMDRVIFACAHPAMFRWLFFAESEGEKSGDLHRTHNGRVIENNIPPELGKQSLYLGSTHLFQVERWQDGGEKWILDEYKRQTTEE